MPLNNPEGSIGSAAEFQSSGLPWVTSSVATSSPQRFDFPKVSRNIVVRNTTTGSGGFLVVGFTRNGVLGTNNFMLPPGSSESFEVRVKELHVVASGASCNYSVLAALTTVSSKHMPILTGSIASGSTTVSMWDGVG